VTLQTCPNYKLREIRSMHTWPEVKQKLGTKEFFDNFDHVEVLLNPYNDDCLVTQRKKVPTSTKTVHKTLHSIQDAMLRFISPKSISWFFNVFHECVPNLITSAMKALEEDSKNNQVRVDDYVNVFDIGVKGDYGNACEVGFPFSLDGTQQVVKAVETIKQKAKEMSSQNIWHTSPFDLRFVRQCSAHMSMMNKSDTCMIEIPLVNGTNNGEKLLKAVETSLIALGGIPHWGLEFDVFSPKNNDEIVERFPKFMTWLENYRHWNKDGLFSNEVTTRLGLDNKSPTMGQAVLLGKRPLEFST